jgi:hypothetical protein
VDPYLFIRCFGGWLRAKLFCDGELPENEERFLDTPGEALLKHIEMDLNPVKSYKMVVLKILLDLPGTAWEVEKIAREFRDYFIAHPENLYDYEEMARAVDPGVFPLSRIAAKLKSMPLNFLSNTEKDPFILDRGIGLFRLKEEFLPFWNDAAFRELLRERVEFTLLRYFQRHRRTSDRKRDL